MTTRKTSFKLPVGIDKDTGSLLRIDEVSRGLGCNCLCPGCKTPLVARKGELKSHHFAHHTPPPESTLSCAESALHKWAKNIVARQKAWGLREKHFVPKVWTTRFGEKFASHDESWSPFSDKLFIIQSAEEEYDMGDWKPDVLLIGHFGDIKAKLAIEIKVSHAVDEPKLAKVQESDINLLEIELSPDLMLEGVLTEEALQEQIFDHKNQHWLHSPLASRLKAEHDLTFEKQVVKPLLEDQEKQTTEFATALVGQTFQVPQCLLYDFPDDLQRGAFSFFANGKVIDVAKGQEEIAPPREYPVAKTELLDDRIRLYLVTNRGKEHPIDLVLHSDQAEPVWRARSVDDTSSLTLQADFNTRASTWLESGQLRWVFSKRRSNVIKDLRGQLSRRRQAEEHKQRMAQQKRREAANRLAAQIIQLFDQYKDSEPEWSRSHRERFIEARELARALGEGPYGGNGLTDRTPHDWIFGVPGQQWKTIVAAEMITNPDCHDAINFRSLRFYLRKNRLFVSNALSSLQKLDEGPKTFENHVMHLNRNIKLPTAGSALHHWLSHLARVQPNLIAPAGQFNKGFRWMSGRREEILAESRSTPDGLIR